MRITYILAMILAFVPGAADAGIDRAEAALPAGWSEYLKGKLSPDADRLISVFGAVRNPHTIPPAEGLTVSKAIEMAGGFPDFANRRRVGVWRPKDGRYFTVDVKAVLQNTPGAEDPPVNAGDVVIIIMRLVD
jgi:hypothetical protein